MQPSWLVLLPPLIVLLIAFTTRRIITSLFIGIVIAAAIATNFVLIDTLTLTVTSLFEKGIDIDNLYIFAFLLCLGMTLSLINYTGGALALGNLITTHLSDAKSTETASLMLSFILAIDDYLSCLTTGYVMQPLADRFKIARIKLSFLVNSMTAPLTILIPISSWAGFILRQFSLAKMSLDATEQPKVLVDPLIAYFKTIPFILYSFIAVGTVIFIVRRRISYGTIKAHENIVQQTGNLFGGKEPLTHTLSPSEHVEQPSFIDFLVPMGTLFLGFFAGILYSGDFNLFGGANSFVEAFKHAKVIPVLFIIGVITITVTILLALIRKKVSVKKLPTLLWEGINLTLPAIILIFFAWTFSSLLSDNLAIGEFLASTLLSNVSQLILPAMLFIATASVSFIIGSSWGTIAMMLPIAVDIITVLSKQPLPTEISHVCLLIPCIGAVLSGAIAGNHLSPIADVSIMSTTSCGAYHLDHVKGQTSYILPAFIATIIAFLVVGLIPCEHHWIAMPMALVSGLVVSFSIVSLLNQRK